MLPSAKKNSEHIKTEVILTSQIGQGILYPLLDKLNVDMQKRRSHFKTMSNKQWYCLLWMSTN